MEAFGRDADLRERAQPGVDPDVDRVHERPVEVEDHGRGVGHGRGRRLLVLPHGTIGHGSGQAVKGPSPVSGRGRRRDVVPTISCRSLFDLAHDGLA